MRSSTRRSQITQRKYQQILRKQRLQQVSRCQGSLTQRLRRAAERLAAFFRPSIARYDLALALRWRFKLGMELLEPKLVLSGSNPLNVFAEARDFVRPHESTEIPISVQAPAFDLTGESTILSFRVRANGGGTLDPAAVQIRDSQGQLVTPVLFADNLHGLVESQAGPQVSDSLALVDLGFGEYTVQVLGEHGTSGDFELAVALVGDLDGDGDVGLDDRAGVRALQRNQGYQLEADANVDGRITSLD